MKEEERKRKRKQKRAGRGVNIVGMEEAGEEDWCVYSCGRSKRATRMGVERSGEKTGLELRTRQTDRSTASYM